MTHPLLLCVTDLVVDDQIGDTNEIGGGRA